MIAVSRRNIQTDRARARRLSVGGILAGGAVALLLLIGLAQVLGIAPWVAHVTASSRAPAAAQTVDPRLILTPRTLTQAATAAGVRVELTAEPLIPGANRFALRLSERGRPLAGARVVLTAIMTGMAMRPITLSMSQGRPGRYAATGPLTMFGQWLVTVRIDRPGAAPLTHRFTVGVNLPQGLLAGSVTQGAAGQ